MADKKTFFEAVADRKTVYALSNEPVVPDARIKEIVENAIKDTPSAFNSQTTRLVVVLGKKHEELWDAVAGVYKSFLPEDKFKHLNERFVGHRAGYGTILCYEDPEAVNKIAEKWAQYKDYFPQWSEQTNAMHQYSLWTALTAEGHGANLQHYQPPITPKLAELFDVPKDWSLKAQLVFGKPLAGRAYPKTFEPVESRVKFVGGNL